MKREVRNSGEPYIDLDWLTGPGWKPPGWGFSIGARTACAPAAIEHDLLFATGNT
jgi:hypothetical protein